MHPHASPRAGVWLGCLTAGLVLGSGSPATPAEQVADSAVAATAAGTPAPAAAPAPATPPAATRAAAAPPPPAEPHVDPKAAVSFERDIRPIFKAYCFDCHGSEAEHKGELDLRLRRLVAKGGESGPAIAPGDATASLLVHKLRGGEMPPSEKKVPSEQIAKIEAWIAAGARRCATSRPRAGRKRSRPRSGTIGRFSRRRCRRFPRSPRPIGCERSSTRCWWAGCARRVCRFRPTPTS